MPETLAPILVVEDDPTILEFTAELLADDGLEVIRARDCEEALAVMEGGRIPSVLVTDIGLAVPNRAVFGFLDKNAIAYLRADATNTLTTDQVLAEAHGFVRQIGCWK